MSHVHCVTPLTLVSTTRSGQVRHVGSWPSAQIVLLTARRVVSHCLRISGEQVAICTKTLPIEFQDVLQRLRGSSSTSGTGAACKIPAVGKTPSAAMVLASSEQREGAVDEALAKLICTNDLS